MAIEEEVFPEEAVTDPVVEAKGREAAEIDVKIDIDTAEGRETAQLKAQKSAMLQELLKRFANNDGVDLPQVPDAVNDMKQAMQDSGLDKEDVKIPSDDPNDIQNIKRINNMEQQAEAKNPERMKQFRTFGKRFYETKRMYMKRLAKDQTIQAMENTQAAGQAWMDALNRGDPNVDRYYQQYVNSMRASDRAMEADTKLKTQVKAESGTNGWDVLKAFVKYGGIALAIWLLMKAVSQALSGCYMYTAEKNQPGNTTKLSCPTSDHQNQCGCDQTPANCKACSDVNYPYCCDSQSVAWGKCCTGTPGSTDGYVYYVWKDVSPWDVPGLAVKGIGDLIAAIGAGFPAVWKWLMYIFIAFGLILFFVFILPAILNAFKKK